MALPFLNPVSQSMPGYGSPSCYGAATQALSATATMVIAATSTTPSSGGTPFNPNGDPAPSRGKIRIRFSNPNGATTFAAVVTATDGTTTLQIDAIGATAAGTSLDYTREFNTDLGITSISIVATLGGGTTTGTLDVEVSLV